MAIIEINKDPGAAQLRWFGVIVALFCGLVGALLHWHFGAPGAARVVWAVGLALALVYYLVPPLRMPLYLGWMYLFFPIGFVLSHVVLGVTYYLVLTPIGLLMRLFGRDPMHRRFDPEAESYWIARDPNVASERYFRQF